MSCGHEDVYQFSHVLFDHLAILFKKDTTVMDAIAGKRLITTSLQESPYTAGICPTLGRLSIYG